MSIYIIFYIMNFYKLRTRTLSYYAETHSLGAQSSGKTSMPIISDLARTSELFGSKEENSQHAT